MRLLRGCNEQLCTCEWEISVKIWTLVPRYHGLCGNGASSVSYPLYFAACSYTVAICVGCELPASEMSELFLSKRIFTSGFHFAYSVTLAILYTQPCASTLRRSHLEQNLQTAGTSWNPWVTAAAWSWPRASCFFSKHIRSDASRPASSVQSAYVSLHGGVLLSLPGNLMKIPCGCGAAYAKRETVAVDPVRHREEAAPVTMVHGEDVTHAGHSHQLQKRFAIMLKYSTLI